MKSKIKVLETLKDLKDVLVEIPDEDLVQFGIGPNYESDCEITILVASEDEIELFDKYKPQLDLVEEYLDGILACHIEAQKKDSHFFDNLDFEGFITSSDNKRIAEYYKENSEMKEKGGE